MSETIADDPLLGQQLANFRLERVIGRGGMAIVYYGIDVKLNRPVAVKVIDARYRNNPIYAERFVRESQVVATWRHPHILQVYYADDQEGLYYFVMEYIDGLDLRQLVDMYNQDGQLMPHQDVLRIGHAVADALDYAHARGVIHRDVKPSNVMTSHDGRVLLMDFGLALQINEGSIGQVFGTPHYMAPEQARRSADAVPQSDLYSLGVLLFEMLTSQVPFDDSSPTSVAIQHITQTPPSPKEINPQLNKTTDEILLKALDKNPADRYQTGRELMDALETALREGAEEFERDALPPLPATIQQTPSEAARPRINPMTVAERLALQFDTHNRNPTQPYPQPQPKNNRKHLHRIGLILTLTALASLLLLAWFGRNNLNNWLTNPTQTPTTLAILPPANTQTPTPTQTTPPTSTTTTTPTPSPTSTTTPRPTTTNTPTPTLTPSTTPTPSPTPIPSLLLIYNRTGLYVLNTTTRIINLDPLTFNAITQNGEPTNYVFRATTEWRFKQLSPGYCGGIEIIGANPTRPSRCEGFGMLTFPGSDAAGHFWADRSNIGITEFRVAWFGETVKQCRIVDGFCMVSLPAP